MTVAIRTLGALLVATTIAVVGWLLLSPEGTHGPLSAEAAALFEFTDVTPDEYRPDVDSLRRVANEGGVVHEAQQYYKRHGDIPQRAFDEDPFLFPETYTTEYWKLLSDTGQVIEAVQVSRSSDGTVVQWGIQSGNTLTIMDGDLNVLEEIALPTEGIYSDLNGLLDGASDHYAEQVRLGVFEREDRMSATHGSVVVYRDTTDRMTAANGQQQTTDAYSVPYKGDYPSQPLQREETVVAGSHMPISSSTWIDVGPGETVLIESIHWLVFEGLPASAWCSVVPGAACESKGSVQP